FDTTAGNPVKKILLKLNLSDHRIFKMEVELSKLKVLDALPSLLNKVTEALDMFAHAIG
ncbi:hypothetical protein Tco_1565348, partial [Tanacetum coccineum]